MADPITVQDLQDATLDVTTIAEVAMVGTNADTTQNREGVTLDTLQGRLNKVGFEPPIAYVAGLTFTDGQDAAKTVDQSGVIYASLASARPFTTTDWPTDQDKFFVVQDPTNSGGNVRTDNSNTYDNGTTQTMDALVSASAVVNGVDVVGATATINVSVASQADNTAGSDSVIVGALDSYKRFRVEGNVSVVNQSLSGANSIILYAFFYQKDGTQYNQGSNLFDSAEFSTALVTDSTGTKIKRVIQDVFFSGADRNHLTIGSLDIDNTEPNGSISFDMLFENSSPIDLGYFKIGYQRGSGDGSESLELSGLIKVTGLA